jgi:dihydrodipicolinate synthase/N-acetylneuraminate lyase
VSVAQESISGTLAAAVTPLRDGGDRLDEGAFEPLLDFYGKGGLQGILVLGTTGEGILLTATERRRVAKLAVAGAGTLRVMVHCGAQTTAETRSLSSHAAEIGADAVAVIAPPYFPFDVEELTEHFATAAEACAPLPFYLYEYADRSGYAIPVAVIEKLGERVSNLVGIKVSDAPYERLKPYLTTGLDVFVGSEALIGQGFEEGAVGAISAVAGAFPEAVSALVADPTADRAALVEALAEAISAHPLQAAVKAALALRGVPVQPDVRAPLRPLHPDALDRLRNAALVAEATVSSWPKLQG